MSGIHPTALVSPEAEIAGDVTIGPFAVIEGPVRLGPGVSIGGHARIAGQTDIGAGSSIGWGAIIGADPQDLSFDPATSSGVVIGTGNIIREYVTIHRGTRAGSMTIIGSGNFLMTGVHLGHDVTMGDSNILANNVLLGGHVTVGDRAFLGGGAAFHQFVRIGDLAMSQGLAIVSQDIPPYCVGHGRNSLAGLNSIGLRRAGFDSAVRADIKRAYHLLFLSGKPRQEALAEAAAQDWSPQAARLVAAITSPSRKGVASP